MITHFIPMISMFIIFTVYRAFHIFALSLIYFQNFPGPEALFQDFPVLESPTQNQDFPGFPGPVRTQKITILSHVELTD